MVQDQFTLSVVQSQGDLFVDCDSLAMLHPHSEDRDPTAPLFNH
jgi:hypothetical protein